MIIIFIKFRSVFIVLLLILIVGQATPVLAKQSAKLVDVYFVPMQFMFDDTQLTPPSDQQGFIYKNSTYVPMRFISYSLDKTVEWDPATYTVSVSQPSDGDQTTIDAYKRDREVAKGEVKPMDTSKLVPSGIKVYEEKISYVFDGETKQPKEGLPGLIYKDRLYVPMRFFSEAVGQKIEWDPKTYTVKSQTASLTDKVTVDSEPLTTPIPTPTPTSTTGQTETLVGSGQAGSVGTPVKPTYEELKGPVDASILVLKNKAFGQLLALLSQYQAADASTKLTIKAQGNAMVAGYDAEFAGILSSFQSQLIANGYSTSIIATYQQEYNNQKQLAQGFLN